VARQISLTVKPQAKFEAVTELSANDFKVSVCPAAKDGRANVRVIELLAEYFHIAKSKIRIVRGHSARKKLVEID
jgi:uncharacterized protein YggU (UPF0235/DUF167 family)